MEWMSILIHAPIHEMLNSPCMNKQSLTPTNWVLLKECSVIYQGIILF